ncbi:MAG: response regulator [Gammaproteobacteria bacterium]
MSHPDTAPKTILLVDDDEVFCATMARALTRLGHPVLTAHNSDEALRLAADAEHAVIDLRIGEESGLNLIDQLHHLYPQLRMVILTGFSSIATAVEAIKLGAVHYLTKPTEASDIVTAFARIQGDAAIDIHTQPMSVNRLEWEHLQRVLTEHDGNISAAARALGMHRRTLQRKLQKKPVSH